MSQRAFVQSIEMASTVRVGAGQAFAMIAGPGRSPTSHAGTDAKKTASPDGTLRVERTEGACPLIETDAGTGEMARTTEGEADEMELADGPGRRLRETEQACEDAATVPGHGARSVAVVMGSGEESAADPVEGRSDTESDGTRPADATDPADAMREAPV